MRLTDSRDFERVYREGSVYRGRLLSVHAYPNGLENPRLGLAVSKRVGSAVIRNKLRRRIREIFFWRRSRIDGKGYDLVVSARPAAASASFGELEDEFDRALEKLVNGTGEGRGDV
ncbi:MAG: ribonuclease P protein component [Rubrobacteraceae bacterium]|nr:ribonuclease P protein component [Rubrobacteraceae bacterium]MCL6438459.1 ribonuclease P protein component [Rubrobacteraceae bacterium]